MNKNLPTTQTNSKAVIQKSNFLFGLKDKLITKDRKDLVDDSWIDRLCKWADENKINIDDNLLDRTDNYIPKIDIDYDEIPF